MLFLVLLIHGATLGLTDDETYYWVLAQKPALGYAFHPPAVAWTVALFQKLTGGSLPRLPAALFSGWICAMGIHWMKIAQATPGGRKSFDSVRGGRVLVAFAGLFAASWMIVPDLPLFLGWMLLFVSSWNFCSRQSSSSSLDYAGLVGGSFLLLLSKYSGVLAIGSAGLAILLWADRKDRMKACLAIVAGTFAALVPVLVWNSQHEWASLLYQIRDRHGGASFSAIRYLRFWLIQLVFAGPALVFFFVRFLPSFWRPQAALRSKFVLLWIAPAFMVFCTQPAWSDFKAHWALVVWLPLFLEFGAQAGAHAGPYGSPESNAPVSSEDASVRKWGRAQTAYGLTLLCAALLFCQFPAISWVMEKTTGKVPDPRWDVGNDMFGWSQLARFIKAHPQYESYPVLGSRYQTAAQAAYALRDQPDNPVSFIPRDLKQKDEWPMLNVTSSDGPDWPSLKRSVLFVGDQRYDAGPEFKDADCKRISSVSTLRSHYIAKKILIWECRPKPLPKS